MQVRNPVESILTLAASVFNAYSVVLFEVLGDGQKAQILAAYSQGSHLDQNAVILPGVPGRIVDWQSQLAAMQNAVNECRTAIGLSDAGFDPPGAWPQASQINQLRTAIENT